MNIMKIKLLKHLQVEHGHVRNGLDPTGIVRVAETRMIWHQQMTRLCKAVKERKPFHDTAACTVQEQNGPPLASFAQMKLATVNAWVCRLV